MRDLSLNLLPLPELSELIHNHGVYLAKREDNQGRKILLYALENQYVEIHYIHYREIIHKIEISEDILILEPFLSKIDIQSLLNGCG